MKYFNLSYWYNFFVQGPPNFRTCDLATLKNTLSVSHSPRLLATGPIRNAEIMESPLTIDNSLYPYYNAWFPPIRKASNRSQDPSKQQKRIEKLKLCRTLTNEYDNEHIIYHIQKRRNTIL